MNQISLRKVVLPMSSTMLTSQALVKSSETSQALEALLLQSSSVPMIVGNKRGRPQKLSSQFLCLGVLICLVRGWQSQLEVWRLIRFTGLGAFAPVLVSDQAVYKRLAQHSSALLQTFFQQMSAWLCEHLALLEDRSLAPFASMVVALDESILDPKKRWVAALRGLPKGDRGLLAGRIAALFNVRLQQWIRIDVLEAVTDCKVHARAMLSSLPAHALVLFDRGYNAFEWFDDLTSLQLYWIGRVKKNMSYRVLHVYYEGNGIVDRLIQIGAYRSDRARYTARLVSYHAAGKRFEYLTNVTDPQQLSVAMIVRLYARRWDIECAFRTLKDHLGLKWLWSAKWEVIQVQIWATAILAQVFQAYQVQIAAQAEVDVFDVSLELLVRHVPQFLAQGKDPIRAIVEQGRAMNIIRPSTRRRPEVFVVPVDELRAPPADLVWEREPRYDRRPAGNLSRKAKATT